MVDIPKNVSPFQNCRKVRWFKFKKDDIAKLPREILEMVEQFYGSDGGYYYIPNHGLNGDDISFYLNHSPRPNIATKGDSQNFATLRKIKKGEELFIDYRTYDPEDKILSR